MDFITPCKKGMSKDILSDHVNNEKKDLKESSFLTKLQGSVISIQGKFENLFLNEEDVYFYHTTETILCSESNYGRNRAHGYRPKKKKKKKKKTKDGKKTKRKAQGNGTQFNSMIQFHIKSHDRKDKIYKIKCFRRETFVVPGVLKADYSDVIPSLIKLRDYHRFIHLDDSIKITDIFSTLVNYKCRIHNKNLKVLLHEVITELNKFKNDPHDRNHILQILSDSPRLTHTMVVEIKKYITVNRFDMAEIKYEPERVSSGLTVKFHRPSIRIITNKNLKAKSTIKIFQSGKLNLDSVKSIDEAMDFYWWLENFFQTRNVLLDVTKPNLFDESDDSDDSDDSE